VQAKIERNSSRIEKLAEVEAKLFSKIVSFYTNEKANFLNSSAEPTGFPSFFYF
jgi:hypothetical protein